MFSSYTKGPNDLAPRPLSLHQADHFTNIKYTNLQRETNISYGRIAMARLIHIKLLIDVDHLTLQIYTNWIHWQRAIWAHLAIPSRPICQR